MGWQMKTDFHQTLDNTKNDALTANKSNTKDHVYEVLLNTVMYSTHNPA